MISRHYKSSSFLLLSFLLVLLLSSCYGSWNVFYEGNDVDKRTEELLLLNNTNEEFAASGISALTGSYTVLVISDIHFGSDKKEIETDNLFAWLDGMRGKTSYPSFVLSLGDVVDTGKPEQYSLYQSFCHKLKSEYNLPLILHACGNHDIYQNNWDNWKANCYPYTSFYKFYTEKFSWYCLDTASGTIGQKQYKKLLSDFNRDSRPKIIYTHYPFTRFNIDCANMAETTERNKLLSDFSKNSVKCVLGGHNHNQTFDDLGFLDYGIPSLGYYKSWGLLYIDENAASARVEFIK